MRTTENLPDFIPCLSDPVIAINSNYIYLDDLLWPCKTTRPAEPGPLREALLTHLAVREAVRRGIEAADDELAGDLASFYEQRGLQTPEQIDAWHAERQLTAEQVGHQLERELLRRKLEALLAADDRIVERFAGQPRQGHEAVLDALYFRTPGIAAEILLAMREQEHTWNDATALSCGGGRVCLHAGDHTLGDFTSLVFPGRPGDLIGPHEMPDGRHAIYRIEELRGIELDEELTGKIRRELLDEFYAPLLDHAAISFER